VPVSIRPILDAFAVGWSGAEVSNLLDPGVDVICLAQVCMASARAAVQARVRVPVLTSPGAAVARLKAMLTEDVKRKR
jgi:Asp/Glu/hydantoin racemase